MFRIGSSAVAILCAGLSVAREIAVPLPEHPGHVYLEGERVSLPLPPSFKNAVRWEVRDVTDGVVTGGVQTADAGWVEAGVLPLGWYRISGSDASGKVCAWTTAAVLRKLVAPVSEDSPVCIDTANAWFTRTESPEGDLKMMAAFANLTALAGVNGARDRLTWGEIEPSQGTFAEKTRYDDSARILRGEGLQVLQVFHGTPGWARTPGLEQGDGGGRYPRDLRDQYRFCKAMGARFKGVIQAWEPWNEANIPVFGGHVIDEMCSLQKASYLGFKAAGPSVTVCWNVFAGSGTALHTQGVLANGCWPYFDTYNIHSYSGVESYLSEFEPARQAACGKPLWISECGVPVPWSAEHGDLSDNEDVRQARFVPKSFAATLFAGVAQHYFFILGNYSEGKIQFGLLRHDLTPRRGYLALAATGRLLAGARPLGRLTDGALRAYAFRARPDGAERDVLVAWADTGSAPATFAKELRVEAASDGYGRPLAGGIPSELGEAPVFIVLPVGEAGKLKLEKPLCVSPAPHAACVSPVVMQTLFPQQDANLALQGYQVKAGVEQAVSVAVYNFHGEPVNGKLRVASLPAGWRVTLPEGSLGLRPMERQVLSAKVLIPAAGRDAIFGAPVVLSGDFGPAGEALLSFRLACDADAVRPAQEAPIRSAEQESAWGDNIVGGAKMTHEMSDGRMMFTMDFGDQDPWGYPVLKLAANEKPPEGFDGLEAEVELLEGQGELRAQFAEAGGSAYLGDLPYRAPPGGKQTVTLLFEHTVWGTFSRADTDNKLTLPEVSSVLIGINAKKNSRVRLSIGNLRWVKY